VVAGGAILLLAVGLLARFALADSGDPSGSGNPVMSASSAPSASLAPSASGGSGGTSGATAAIVKAQALLRRIPDDPRALTDLGLAYLARAHETADPSFYVKAEQALARSDALAPHDLRTMVGTGLLRLSRHEFDSALELGLATTARYPDSAEALGLVVDAQVELGRYPAAVASAQAMLDRRPDIASLARISYLRELYGDQDGAIAAMIEARSAGSGSPTDLAYVSGLLGDLFRARGKFDEAATAYRDALHSVPRYSPAQVGLARVDAARGDLAKAARRLEPVASRTPLPETLALYGDVLTALGRPIEAAQLYERVRAAEVRERASGVEVDLESAHFEADHARDPGGRPAHAVEMAREALAGRPTVYGHDTLAWALRQAGSPARALPEADAALALGTRDAVLYYHRAAIRADLGRRSAAAADLRTAFSICPALLSSSPSLSIRDLSAARALARRLGVPVPAV